MASLKEANLGRIPLTAGAEPAAGYRLIRRLGGGGFGEVWEAEGPGGFHVALKFVPLGERAGEVELRSLEILKGIHHPNLLVTFGAWENNGYLVVAMELADRTLWDRFQEAVGQGLPGIPREELHEYIMEAAKGIDHLNAQKHAFDGESGIGVQHRDIKPQNILLVGGGVKVADFGLARFLKHAVTHHTGCLTPAYAAPEFFRGQTSSHSDQYSLAATYCHLRGGRPPHCGTASEVMFGHLNGIPDLMSLPEDERAVVARALAKEPAQRWPSCRAFAEALRGSPAPLGHSTPVPAPSAQSGPRPTELSEEAPQTCRPAAWGAGAVDTLPAKEPRTDTAGPNPTMPTARTSPSGHGGKVKVWFMLAGTLAVGLALGAIVKLRPINFGLLPFPNASQATDDSGTEPHPAPSASRLATNSARGVEKTSEKTSRLRIDAPATVSLRAGERRRVEVQLVREDLDRPVAIHLEGLPAGLAATEATVPASGSEASVEIVAADDAIEISKQIKLVASAGPSQAETLLNLTVQPKASLRVVESPATLHVRAGKETAFTVVIRREAFDGPVSVRFPDLPKGVTIEQVTVPAQGRSAVLKAVVDEDAEEGETMVHGVAAALTTKAEAELSVAINVVSAPFHRKQGDLLVNKADFKQAVAEYTEAIRINPEDTVALVSRGSAYSKLNQQSQAIADYDAVIRLRPDSALAYRNRGNAYRLQGKFDQAVRDCTEAIRLDPNDAIAWGYRGEVYHSEGKEDKAIVDYTAAIRLRPRDPALYADRGFSYLEQRKLDAALADYEEALKLKPKYPIAFKNRGYAYYLMGKYDKAIADANMAIHLDPKYAAAYNGRALAYHAQREYGRALADYAEALQLSKDAVIYVNRAETYVAMKNYDLALGDYDQALRLDARSARVHNDRGYTFALQKDYAKAIADYSEAVAINPKYTVAYRNRAVAHAALRDYDKAIADYSEVIRLDPKSVAAYNGRGAAYRDKGDLARAVADFTHSIQINPKLGATHNLKAAVHLRLKEFEHCIDEASQAIRLDSKNAEPWNCRGAAYSWKKDFDSAIRDYTKAIELNPHYAKPYENRALAYQAKGLPDKAKADMAKYHQLIGK